MGWRVWGLTVVRVSVVVAALALTVWLAEQPVAGDWRFVLIVVPLGVAVGAVTNRWWVVAIPAAITVIALASSVIFDGTDSGELSWAGVLILSAVFTVAAQLPLAAGVGMRRLWARRFQIRDALDGR